MLILNYHVLFKYLASIILLNGRVDINKFILNRLIEYNTLGCKYPRNI